MENYAPDRRCACARCRWHGLMGPALLITLGILILLDNLHALQFQDTWPAILIAIGAVKLLQTIAPTTGHTALPPPAAPAGETAAAPTLDAAEAAHE